MNRHRHYTSPAARMPGKVKWDGARGAKLGKWAARTQKAFECLAGILFCSLAFNDGLPLAAAIFFLVVGMIFLAKR